MSVNTKHIQPLDGLRTLAVGCVVLTHYASGDSVLRKIGIDWAIIGVHTFFVLSGFLITKLLTEKYFRDADFFMGFAAFLIARIGRIAPLAFLGIGVVWALYPGPLPQGFFAYNLTFLANFYTAATGHWFPDVGHYWSLAVEMQFYFAYPFLVWIAQRRILPTLVGALALLLLVQEVIALSSIYPSYSFLLPARADAFLWGGVVYCLSRSPQFQSKARLLLLVGFVLYAGQTYLHLVFGSPVFVPTIIAGNIFFAGLVAVCLDADSVVARILSMRPLVRMGAVSYGIYIWHPIVPRIAVHLYGLPIWAKVQPYFPNWLLWILLTIVATELSWNLLERPVNRAAHITSKRILASRLRQKELLQNHLSSL